MTPLLAIEDVHAYYGHSHVLQGVSLAVPEGQIVALLGRNGAGKTTTMRTIMGLTEGREGPMRFRGRDVRNLSCHRIARLGIGYVPSGRRAFGSLTVEQNLALGGAMSRDSTWPLARIYALFPALERLAARRARYLSGGEQQMLKVGRALAASPEMLLLDEPTEGLAPQVVAELKQWLRMLKDEGLTLLLAEQSARFALDLSDHAYVLEKGTISYEGTASELRDSGEMRAHLGVGELRRR